MNNLDDKHPIRPVFESSTLEFRAIIWPIEPLAQAQDQADEKSYQIISSHDQPASFRLPQQLRVAISLTSKLINRNFHPLEVVNRGNGTQIQVTEAEWKKNQISKRFRNLADWCHV